MNCGFVQEKILDDLEHRFDGKVADHLGHCSECRQFCDDLIALQELAQSLGGRYHVPTAFRARVLASAPESPRSRFFRWRAALVPLAIVMLSFGWYWMNAGAESRDDSIVAQETAEGHLAVDMDDTVDGKRSSFIEMVVEHPGDGEMIVQLPSVIEIRRTDLHEDFYYQTTGY